MEIQFRSGAMRDAAYTGELEKAESQASRAERRPEQPAAGDTVTVSHDALLLTEANRAARDSPDVRSDRVEALRIQVNNGAYKPDSRLIAANMIREEPGLFRI